MSPQGLRLLSILLVEHLRILLFRDSEWRMFLRREGRKMAFGHEAFLRGLEEFERVSSRD